MTDERCLRDPQFWRMLFGLFLDEQKVIEFFEVSGIPADHIRRARADYQRRIAPHVHGSNVIH
jgi:hypothetical protein